MYVLSWRTVYKLTRVLFWCLFPSLLRSSGNKHQNNPLYLFLLVCEVFLPKSGSVLDPSSAKTLISNSRKVAKILSARYALVFSEPKPKGERRIWTIPWWAVKPRRNCGYTVRRRRTDGGYEWYPTQRQILLASLQCSSRNAAAPLDCFMFHTPTHTTSSKCLMLHRTIYGLWNLYGNSYRNHAEKEGTDPLCDEGNPRQPHVNL